MLLNDGVSDSGARVRVSRVSSYIDRHLFWGGSLFFSLMLRSSLLLLDELLLLDWASAAFHTSELIG